MSTPYAFDSFGNDIPFVAGTMATHTPDLGGPWIAIPGASLTNGQVGVTWSSNYNVMQNQAGGNTGGVLTVPCPGPELILEVKAHTSTSTLNVLVNNAPVYGPSWVGYRFIFAHNISTSQLHFQLLGESGLLLDQTFSWYDWPMIVRVEVRTDRIVVYLNGWKTAEYAGTFDVTGYLVGAVVGGYHDEIEYIYAAEPTPAPLTRAEQVEFENVFTGAAGDTGFANGIFGISYDGSWGGIEATLNGTGGLVVSPYASYVGLITRTQLTPSDRYFVEAVVTNPQYMDNGWFGLIVHGGNFAGSWWEQSPGVWKHGFDEATLVWWILENTVGGGNTGSTFDARSYYPHYTTGINYPGGPWGTSWADPHPAGDILVRVEVEDNIASMYLDGNLQRVFALPFGCRQNLDNYAVNLTPGGGSVGFYTRSGYDITPPYNPAPLVVKNFRAGLIIDGVTPPPSAFWTTLRSSKEKP